MDPALGRVFIDAAAPQKLMFIGLACAPLAAIVAVIRCRRPPRWLRELRVVGPTLGLLCAVLNGFHMTQTTLRLAASPPAKLLAPGLMETAALVEVGAFAGLVAVIATGILETRRRTCA